MNGKAPRKKIPVKTIFHHVIRAKIYGVLTLNALEGMILEMNHLIPQDADGPNFDIFDEGLHRYQNGVLFPTCHGDYLDRAVKSLAKELDIPVSVDLINAQAVKKVILSIARGSTEEERKEIAEWLNENNDYIVKSPRYEQLIDNACIYFYKKPASQLCDDTLAFIRRSASELLRNKTSKDAMRKKLLADDDEQMDKSQSDLVQKESLEMNDSEEKMGNENSDDDYILDKKMFLKRGRGDVEAIPYKHSTKEDIQL